jgi:hypothetical protein
VSIGKRSKYQVAKSRPIVFERDQETCIVAGSIWETIQPCMGILTLQHRVGRGMGGSARWDAPNCLVTMCIIHNGLIESSYEFRNYCERNGLAIRRAVADRMDVASIPVRYSDGWFLLSGDSRFAISEATAEAVISELYDLD